MADVAYSHTCEICGADDWAPVFTGPLRDGSFGSLTSKDHTIYECAGCAVQRLEESACKDDSFYSGKKYRELLGEASNAAGHQLRNLNVFWPHSMRNRVVADIGCAAGSFLDHIRGLPKTCLAIEPCEEYHESLRDRSYRVYPSIVGAIEDFKQSVDVVFSLSTVEHVGNPFDFFCEIRQLLQPEGLFVVSTPNRNDVLMELLGDTYKQFFYRTVHRWYFDMDALVHLAKRCGFEIVQQRCLQRFGISNAMAWLRDRKPTGDRPLPGLDEPLLNQFWQNYLESKGMGDYLYLIVKRAAQ
jgi:SAM-dependent methyltransferase